MNTLFIYRITFTLLLSFLFFFNVYGLSSSNFLSINSLEISGPDEVCSDQEYSFTTNYSLQIDEYFRWELEDGTIVDKNTDFSEVIVKFKNASVTTISLFVYDAQDMIVTSTSFVLTVTMPLAAEVTSDIPSFYEEVRGNYNFLICEGEEGMFFVTARPGFTYNWSIIGSNTLVQNGNMASVEFNNPGTLTIFITETSPNGCSVTSTIMGRVIGNPNPQFDIVGFNDQSGIEVCESQRLFFSNLTETNNTMGIFEWSILDGNEVVTTYIGRDFNYTFNSNGVYTIRLEYLESIPFQTSESGFQTFRCNYTFENQITVVQGGLIELACINFGCIGETALYQVADTDCSVTNWDVMGGSVVSQSAAHIEVAWDAIGPDGFGVIEAFGNCGTPSQCTTKIFVPVYPSDISIMGPSSICASDLSSIDYVVPLWPGSEYTWSLVDINAQGGSDTPTITFINHEANVVLGDFQGSFTIEVDVLNPLFNCSVDGELTINVIEIEFSPTDFCYGDDIQITPMSSLGLSKIDWSFDFNGSIIQSGSSDASNNYEIFIDKTDIGFPGIYNLSGIAVLESSDYCIFDSEIIVHSSLPLEGSLIGDFDVCLNTPYIYKVDLLSLGSYELDFNISGGIITSQFVNGIYVDWTGPGPHYIEVIFNHTICDLSTSFIQPVNIITTENISIDGPSIVCPDMLVTYSLSDPYAENITWQVNSELGSIIGSSSDHEVDVLWHIGSGITPVELQASFTFCGQFYTTNLLIDFENPSIEIYNDAICSGAPAMFTTNLDFASSYTWIIEDATYSSESALHEFNNGGHYNVILEVLDPNGCPGTFTISKSVFVNSLNFPKISALGGINCPRGNISVDLITNVVSNANYTYEWLHNGVDLQIDNHSITATANGIYTVIVSDGVCSESNYHEIDLDCGSSSCECPPPFSLSIESLNQVGNCGQFQVNGNLTPIGNAINPFWLIPNASGIGRSFVPIDNTPDLFRPFTINEPGYYSVDLTAGYNCGISEKSSSVSTPDCIIADSYSFTVPIITDFDILITCGSSGDYEITCIDKSRTIPNYQYTLEWEVDGVAMGTSSSITFNSQSSTSLPIKLTAIGSDNFVCFSEDNVSLPALPSVDISNINSALCQGSLVTFSPQHTGEVESWDWDFGDNSGSQLHSPSKLYPSTGTYNISLEVTDIFGCSSSSSKSISVLTNNLSGSIKNSPNTCNTISTLLFVNNDGATYVDFNWGPNIYPNSQFIEVMMNGLYTLTATDNNGCMLHLTSNVSVLNEPFGGDILGEASFCSGSPGSYTIIQSPLFSYNWEIVDTQGNSLVPPVSGSGSIQNNYLSMLESGDYLLIYDAIGAGSDICATITKEITVLPSPITPELEVDLISCDPYLTQTEVTNYNDVDYWIINSQILNETSNTFTTSTTGSVGAVVENEYGCISTAIENIPPDIDFSFFLSGCYDICDLDIFTEPLTHMGIMSNLHYHSWTWLLDGQPMANHPNAGPSSNYQGTNSSPKPLDLESWMDGDITLEINNGLCIKESDPFCLNILDCSPCPLDPDVIEFGLSQNLCLHGTNASSLVFSIEGSINLSSLPENFDVCSPESIFFNGGHIDFMYANVNLQNLLKFKGLLFVTDESQLIINSNGIVFLEGHLEICSDDELDPIICQIPILLNMGMNHSTMCIEMEGFMCNNFIVETRPYSLPNTQPPVNNGIVSLPIKLMLPFITSIDEENESYCVIDEYSVVIYGVDHLDNYDPIESYLITQSGTESSYLLADYLDIPLADWNSYESIQLIFRSICDDDCYAQPLFIDPIYQFTSGGDFSKSYENYALHAFPIPFDNQLTITPFVDHLNESIDLSIYSIQGQVMENVNALDSDQNIDIDTSTWPPGIYVIHQYSETVGVKTLKVVKH